MNELDTTWKNCLEMWRWISEQRGDVIKLKNRWLEDNKFDSPIKNNCFFCDYAEKMGDDPAKECLNCPGKLVDNTFNCREDCYYYRYKPKEFYEKIVELDRIRKGKQMSEKMINIEGKEVSESTVVEALKKYIDFKTTSNVPIISFVDCDESKDRVKINLTPGMLEKIRNDLDVKQITININGCVLSNEYNYKMPYYYTNEQPIFGEIKNG